jgi:hypothetical protein
MLNIVILNKTLKLSSYFKNMNGKNILKVIFFTFLTLFQKNYISAK